MASGSRPAQGGSGPHNLAPRRVWEARAKHPVLHRIIARARSWECRDPPLRAAAGRSARARLEEAQRIADPEAATDFRCEILDERRVVPIETVPHVEHAQRELVGDKGPRVRVAGR